MKKATVSALFLAILFIAGLSIFTVACYPHIQLAVSGEKSPGTMLSVILLSVSAAFALVCYVIRDKSVFCLLISFGMFFMAADEAFMIHEHIKQFILQRCFGGDIHKMGLSGEMPILFYLAAGIFLFFKIIKPENRVLTNSMFVIAGLAGAASFTIDLLNISAFLEDTLKLAAEILFSVAMLFYLDERVRKTGNG